MDKGNKINCGYKDEFYCFKPFNDGSLNNLINKFAKLKCIITKNDYIKREITIKDDFKEFLAKENNISKSKVMNDLNFEFKKGHPELAATSTGEINLNISNNMKYEDNNFKTVLKIDVESDYTLFINENLQLLCRTLQCNSIYLGKQLDLFMTSFLLQPIKLKYNNKDYLINVKISAYSSGNLIVQYTIPLDNLEFKYISNNLNNKIEFKCYIPQYMLSNTSAYDYSKEEYTLETALTRYNNHILGFFKNYPKFNVSSFKNYTLVDYDGIPETFDGMNIELSRNIFWILNGPFGYINEREKDTYKNLHKGRYLISNFSSLFVSTNPRSVVLYNKLQPSNDLIKQWFNNQGKYESAIIYLLPSIEMILIKKSYYNLISYDKFNERYSARNLRKKYYDIIKINNYLFHLRNDGYGSVTRLQEFLESNLTDYLPIKFLEENLKNYKEISEMVESNKRNRNNFLVATIAMLFPIVFGLNAIETMTQSLDKYLKTSLAKYSLTLWITVIIFVGLYLSIDIIKGLLHKMIKVFVKMKLLIKPLLIKIKN
ncbi:hypothetical protein [Clostridium aciditolerans]|uniref:Uncharacterized protein n=1 Tax=Clostridium aciditolerans TaxID=339861 RepID=A0A934HWM0_9CLOT|nr:hypothetical protein [Clostridium aciditolerans]MBI6875615.1 hypothetical protein [Clostridium aciditolerans]